ncbi:MAG: LL-diaminopimelate aminotransferase, partial [Clostridiales bacterium]|nr:LL-diaminopimelate aminotransferase [Clostridiales bacterium]
MFVNENYLKLPGAYLFAEIAKRVKNHEANHQGEPIIRLGIGDVTQPLVPVVVTAMHEAVEEMGNKETFKGYGPDYGYDFLLEAIRKNDYEKRGVSLQADEIFVSDGAKSDVSNIQELFAQDVVVAVTDPVYPVYIDSNAMAGRAGEYGKQEQWDQLVYLPCNAQNNFVPELPKEKVDVIYLCYPNNPTGTTLTKAQLKKWIDYAKENESIIVYDAAYKEFISDPTIPKSIYEIQGAKEVAIECCSFSKTAGFTGTRCAWMVIPHEVMGKTRSGEKTSLNSMWKRRMGTKFNGVSYITQKGAAAIYTLEGQKQIKEVISGYMENAKIIRESLLAKGLQVFGGEHAPYIWLKVPG